jgi:hypothetical protein
MADSRVCPERVLRSRLRSPSLHRRPSRPCTCLDRVRDVVALLELFEDNKIMGPCFLDQPNDDLEIFTTIGTLLRDSYVDPAHREGLFLIVEGIEGVEVEANHRDPLGRLGTAVTLRDSTRSVTLVSNLELLKCSPN